MNTHEGSKDAHPSTGDHPGEGAKSPLLRFFEVMRQFLEGSFAHQLYGLSRKELATQEDSFFLILFGDLLGIPVSGYLQLRLLPYFLPLFEQWQQRMSREDDRFWKEMEKLAREF